MTTNRRAAKKLQKENHFVEVADVTPAPAMEDVAEPVAPQPGSNETHPLMSEVELFLSTRDQLAEKLAEEIAATEKKLSELKKIAASLFPERAGGGGSDRKSKKNKVKTSRDSKLESANLTESLPPTDALG